MQANLKHRISSYFSCVFCSPLLLSHGYVLEKQKCEFNLQFLGRQYSKHLSCVGSPLRAVADIRGRAWSRFACDVRAPVTSEPVSVCCSSHRLFGQKLLVSSGRGSFPFHFLICTPSALTLLYGGYSTPSFFLG